MARKRHKLEDIVTKLRQVDVLTSQGRPVAEAVRSIGVTDLLSPMESDNPHSAVKGEEFEIEVYLNILDIRAVPATENSQQPTRQRERKM